jgi:hypothetical protein
MFDGNRQHYLYLVDSKSCYRRLKDSSHGPRAGIPESILEPMFRYEDLPLPAEPETGM